MCEFIFNFFHFPLTKELIHDYNLIFTIFFLLIDVCLQYCGIT